MNDPGVIDEGRADSCAYIDESGGIDKPSCVLGGYLAHRKTWDDFCVDWQAVLDREPQWPALHMVECHRAREAPWCDFAPADREQRLLALVEVIARHKPHAFLVVVNVDAFKAPVGATAHALGEGYPYLLAAPALIASLLRFHEVKQFDFGRIDFVFDFQQQFRASVRKEIEEQFLPSLPLEAPELEKRMGKVEWPLPAECARHVPLQVADMLVWHWRRGRDEPGGRRLPVYQAIKRAAAPLLLRYPETGLGSVFTAHV